ncbi:hypothetical protein [Endozoicomonas sp. ALC020]|uniref:hypothetical protein n=1 Tax=Endozoicomonas sp. ALC020 TaxID=3403077 RepID=UPI003BB01CB1
MKQKSLLVLLMVLFSPVCLSHLMPGDYGLTEESITKPYQANDFLCGSIIVEVKDGWSIEQVRLNKGTIQNQFQFAEQQTKELFFPTQLGGGLLHVRQSTGVNEFTRLYPFSDPVDFELTVSQAGQVNQTKYRITKGICSEIKLGEVKVELKEGNDISYYVQPVVQDDTTGRFWQAWRFEYYTPAYMVIPSPE